MKTMIRYLFDKNKIALLVSVALMSLMMLNSMFLAFLINVALLIITYYKITRFIPYRFNYDDMRKDYTYYQLLPVSIKQFKAINALNIMVWMLVIFASTILYVRFSRQGIQLETILYVLMNTLLIPIVLTLLEWLKKPLDNDTWSIGCVFIGLGQIILMLILNDMVAKGTNIYLYYVVLTIVFVIFAYLRQIENRTFSIDFTLGLNNRYINIFRTSRFYFGERNYITEIGLGWVWFWAFKGEILLVVIWLVMFNAILIVSTIGSFYEEESFIALLPVSLKEKKLTANMASLVSLVFYNAIVVGVFLFFHQNFWVIALNLFVGSIVLGYFAYSLFVTYYHRGKNWIFVPTLTIAFVLLVAFGYSIYPTYGNSVYLPVVLLTIILLIIDYNHHYEVPVLV